MSAFYNEFDPFAAAWLANLMAAGEIAPGRVDTRSIANVGVDDLHGLRRAHFFAGIGGWDYALRLAGWPAEREVWTGSCPCQPFSAAGKRKGFADERHLWPTFFRLIDARRPATVMGEQVAGPDGLRWLDALCDDMEAAGYAVRACVLGGPVVGAPHIRHRIYWRADRLADAAHIGHERSGGARRRGDGSSDGGDDGRLADADDAGSQGRGEPGRERAAQRPAGPGSVAGGLADAYGAGSSSGLRHDQATRHGLPASADRVAGGLADADRGERGRLAAGEGRQRDGAAAGWEQGDGGAPGGGDAGGVADTDGGDSGAEGLQRGREHGQQPQDGGAVRRGDRGARADLAADVDRPDPTNGFWRDADWLGCRDGKWRPVEPGTFPLLDGVSECLARLRSIEADAIGALINHGYARDGDAAQGVRVVRGALREEARREAARSGVCEQLHASPLLLDFLLCTEAACDGAPDRSGFEKAGAEVRQRIVRGVQHDERPDRSPCGRRPFEQQPAEPADPLSAVSFVLARLAEAYRAEARKAHAASGRVGALRGAGNAIIPQVAAAFILATEAPDDGDRVRLMSDLAAGSAGVFG